MDDARFCYALSLRWAQNPDEVHRLYEEAVAKAVELDPLDAEARSSLAYALALHLQPERSKAEFDVALRLNPNSADVLTRYAYWASVFGNPEQGGEMAARAFRLNPYLPCGQFA